MTTVSMHGVGLIAVDDKVLADTARNGWSQFEPESVAAWRSAVGPGVAAIDVGAYTGLYAIIAARAGAEVLAIEPSLASYTRLTQNASRNGVRMASFNCAVGADMGWGRVVAPTVAMTSASRVIADAAGSVRVKTLDCLDTSTPIAAIKIDVEGSEADVLAGGQYLLSQHRPLLVVEAHDKTAESAVKSKLPSGYSCERADGRNLVCRP